MGGMKSLSVFIDDKSYVIPPEGYTQTVNLFLPSEKCFVAVTDGAAENSATLGIQFFASFYGVFQYRDQQIGLAASSKASWISYVTNATNIIPEVKFTVAV